MIRMLLGHVRTTLATLVLLSVPGFAVYSLVHGGLSPRPDVELARVVDAPESAIAAPRSGTEEALIPGWTFSGHKSKPSPYR